MHRLAMRVGPESVARRVSCARLLHQLPRQAVNFSSSKQRQHQDQNKKAPPLCEAPSHHQQEQKWQGRRNATTDEEPSIWAKIIETAATTFASVVVLGIGFSAAAFFYPRLYKYVAHRKMIRAFDPGDPVLDLAAMGKNLPPPDSAAATRWIRRPEQEQVDKIVAGEDPGHYFLILGDKGTGKSGMILEAMRNSDGDGVSMFEAHADLEIFRIRLGKALNYEFHEDYNGSYFSERGPRDTTALLLIERALNKLEKVALERRANKGKPLVVVINQMHLMRDDEDGKDLIELLQQRAEQWAAANLVTVVFNSDDFWVYERFKQLANRMQVVSVTDLSKKQAIGALKKYRARYFADEKLSDGVLAEAYDYVGGRLNFLNRVAKSKDMMATCHEIVDVEKTWFLNKCWILGSEMDDDVMDQQKFATAALVLATALVDKECTMDSVYDPQEGHILPSFAVHEAHQIMTRADFLNELDKLNLFSITSRSRVRANSVAMMRAFREIVAQPGFRQHLQNTIDRIGDIESLGRTRELVAKDLVRGGKYEVRKTPEMSGLVEVVLHEKNEDDDDDHDEK